MENATALNTCCSTDAVLGEQMCPSITVAIPTRDRPDDLRRCLESLTALDYPRWEVLVVDQSEDSRTGQLCDVFLAQLPGLQYCQTAARGASRARNLALQTCTTEMVAFLDDDCTVQADWLHHVAQVFVRHPSAVIVVGTVQAVPHDPQVEFVPSSRIVRETVLHNPLGILRLSQAGPDVEIMSANMCVRLGAVSAAVRFDDYMGTGAPFGSAEDIDYVYRLLRPGGAVVLTPSSEALHYGARTYQSGAVSRMFHTVAYAVGAMDMKLLRCGEWPALIMVPAHTLEYLRFLQPGNLIRRQRPTGLAWIGWYIKGLLASFRLPVDRPRLLYKVAADGAMGACMSAPTDVCPGEGAEGASR